MSKRTHDSTTKSVELSAARLKALIENTYEGIVLYDAHGVIQYASPATKTFFGFLPKDLIGRSGIDFVYREDVAEAKNSFKKALKQKKRITLAQRFIHKNGEVRWAEYTLTNLLDNRDVKGIVSNFRDIHEKKIIETKLQKNQQLLSAINRNISEGIYRSVPEKEFIYVNRAFLELFGFKTLEELNAKTKPADLYTDKKSRNLVHEEIKKKGAIQNMEVLFRKKNGENFWGSISSILVKEANGKRFHDGAIRNITKQKETEKQLEESRNFLDNVMKTCAAPIFVKDNMHRWVMFNDAFCWLLEESRKDLMGKSDKDFFSKDESNKNWKVDNQVLKRGDAILTPEEITLKDGRIKHLLTVKSRYVTEAGEKFVIGFISNVTEIRKREEEINKLNANLLGVMESTHDSIYAIDRDFKYIAYNKNHEQIVKQVYGATIAIGDSTLRFLKGPEAKWIPAEFKRAFKGEYFVSIHRLNQPSFKDEYIEITYNPIFEKRNKVTGVAVFVRDITQRRKSEDKLKVLNDGLTAQNWKLAVQEEDLKATLEELSERNFELDQLMYKTSHDLRSPLSSILGLINLAYLDESKSNHLEYLEKIEGRAKKLDEFIRSMLNYARVNRSEIHNGQINLKEVIEGSLHELEYLDNFSSVKAKIDIKNEGTLFKNDMLRVKILINNIMSNAYKYYNPAVKSFLKIQATITPLNVEMTFRDNGIGIRKEYVGKIFDMFYRATEKSQGSGLGMYIVKQAIDKVKGSIKVKSVFGKGTTIKIVLPNN